jgi:hypothetical protein
MNSLMKSLMTTSCLFINAKTMQDQPILLQSGLNNNYIRWLCQLESLSGDAVSYQSI